MTSAALFQPVACDQVKTWHHRCRTPEETLQCLEPVLKSAGITRVADITGLDRVGIPVFQAVRPYGRLLSVSQGKGSTQAAAQASAVMEGVEIWHAESETLQRIHTPSKAWGKRRKIEQGDLLQRGCDGILQNACMHWTIAKDLADGLDVLVPGDAANLDFSRSADPPELGRSTTGLAGGNSIAEARASALAEIVERSCEREFAQLSMPLRAQRRLDPFQLAADHCRLRDPISKIEAAKLHLDIFDMTNHYQVPAIRVVLYETAKGRQVGWPALGHGAHLDPATAVLRALTEAAQSRLTGISGNRDDISPGLYRGAEVSNWLRAAFNQWDLSGKRRGLDREDKSTHTASGDAERILSSILDQGDGPVVELNLTKPEIGVPVVKILAPKVAFLASP